MVVDGNELSTDMAPQIIEDRLLVPMRAIFEAIGADLEWNAREKTVFARRGEQEVRLRIGERIAEVNGQTVMLEAAPVVLQGRTLVPVRFVSESLGAEVKWQSSSPNGLYRNGRMAPAGRTWPLFHSRIPFGRNVAFSPEQGRDYRKMGAGGAVVCRRSVCGTAVARTSLFRGETACRVDP